MRPTQLTTSKDARNTKADVPSFSYTHPFAVPLAIDACACLLAASNHHPYEVNCCCPSPPFILPGLWLLLLLSCLPGVGGGCDTRWSPNVRGGCCLYLPCPCPSIQTLANDSIINLFSMLCVLLLLLPLLTWQVIYALEAESSGDTLQLYCSTLGRNSIIQ